MGKITGGGKEYSNERCGNWEEASRGGITIGFKGFCKTCRFEKLNEDLCELGLLQKYYEKKVEPKPEPEPRKTSPYQPKRRKISPYF